MCSYGPMVLGYGDPDVERAAEAQRPQGDIFNGPSERLVELAELVVGTVAHADWAMFQKNGTDATTTCVMLARAATGKRKMLVAARRLSWRRAVVHSLARRASPAKTAPTSCTSTTTTWQASNRPRPRPATISRRCWFRPSAMMCGATRSCRRPAFARAARALCDRAGAALILDDVRAGFRLHLAGSWEPLGVRPDLSGFSKAIANG